MREGPEMMPEATQWWEATRERRLLIQHCKDCAHLQLYPRAICTKCHGHDLDYVEASGLGKVYSFTEVNRAARPDLKPPYIVAIVTLSEGPRLLTNVTGSAVACEVGVELDWSPLSDGRNLPTFKVRG